MKMTSVILSVLLVASNAFAFEIIIQTQSPQHPNDFGSLANWSTAKGFTFELDKSIRPGTRLFLNYNYLSYGFNDNQPLSVDSGIYSTQASYNKFALGVKTDLFDYPKLTNFLNPYIFSGIGIISEDYAVDQWGWTVIDHYLVTRHGSFGYLLAGFGVELLIQNRVSFITDFRLEQGFTRPHNSDYIGIDFLKFSYWSLGLKYRI